MGMRNKAVRVAVSLILALLAAGALYVSGKTAPARIRTQGAWVVVKPIQAGEQIPAGAVKQTLVPAGASTAAMVTGQYAEVALVPGEVVLANMVAAQLPTADLGPGEVAVAVPVSGNAAAGARPGDFVDVYWIPQTAGGVLGQAQLLLGDVRVLGPIGQPSSGSLLPGMGPAQSGAGVVLAVDGVSVPKLIGAFGSGQLWLAREE